MAGMPLLSLAHAHGTRMSKQMNECNRQILGCQEVTGICGQRRHQQEQEGLPTLRGHVLTSMMCQGQRFPTKEKMSGKNIQLEYGSPAVGSARGAPASRTWDQSRVIALLDSVLWEVLVFEFSSFLLKAGLRNRLCKRPQL